VQVEPEAEPESAAISHVEPEPIPAAIVEPEPVAVAHTPAPEPEAAPHIEAAVVEPKHAEAFGKPELVVRATETATEPAAASAPAVEEVAEPQHDDKPPVILFKPKESGRKWRIPFVSGFMLMTVTAACLRLM
jgi:hypothetical protein